MRCQFLNMTIQASGGSLYSAHTIQKAVSNIFKHPVVTHYKEPSTKAKRDDAEMFPEEQVVAS